MKQTRMVLLTLVLAAAAASVWAGGKKEVQIEGPPYDVATVMQILGSEALYQQGYLQREMDQNGDGVNDETGRQIYAGELRNFQDANGDGLDDTTGGELPLGLRNRLLDRNGDGAVDGTDESVGQYVNRVRTEAQLRYEQGEGEGDQLQTRTQTQTRSESKDKTQSKSGSSSGTSTGTQSKRVTSSSKSNYARGTRTVNSRAPALLPASIVEFVGEHALELGNELLRSQVIAVYELYGTDLQFHPFRKFRLFEIDYDNVLAFAESEVDLVSNIARVCRRTAHEDKKLCTAKKGLAHDFGPLVAGLDPFIVPNTVSAVVQLLDNREDLRHVLV